MCANGWQVAEQDAETARGAAGEAGKKQRDAERRVAALNQRVMDAHAVLDAHQHTVEALTLQRQHLQVRAVPRMMTRKPVSVAHTVHRADILMRFFFKP